jgi:hypothetical protein
MIDANLGLPYGYEGSSSDTKYGGSFNKSRNFDSKLDTNMFSHSLSVNIPTTIIQKQEKLKNNKTKRNRKH